MNIKKMECPGCSAPLEIKENDKYYVCPYCKSVLQIEKEVEDVKQAKKTYNISPILNKMSTVAATGAVVGTLCMSGLLFGSFSKGLNNKQIANHETQNHNYSVVTEDSENLNTQIDSKLVYENGNWYKEVVEEEVIDAEETINFSVPEGYDLVKKGNNYYGVKTVTLTKPATVKTDYTVPEGYVLKGTYGYNEKTNDKVNAISHTSYIADEGWTISGSWQVKTTKTIAPVKVNKTYNAPAGYSLKGSKAYKYTKKRIPVPRKKEYNYDRVGYVYTYKKNKTLS